MKQACYKPHNESKTQTTFDDLMASLFVLVTHHSLSGCDEILPTIVDRLDKLAGHPDMEFYPNQRLVVAKMQQLWRTRLFGQLSDQHHKMPH